MKKSRIAAALMSILIFTAVLTLGICAEEKIAEGSLSETVFYEIVNYGNEENPEYTLYINGAGAFSGMDSEGKELKYDTREKSVFAPFADNITRIEIGDGIEGIGNYGLAFLKKAKEAVIPESLKSLGGAAFQDCHLLEKVTVRGRTNSIGFDLSTVTSIKAYAFTGCYSMKSITLSNDLTGLLGKQCFSNCRLLDTLTVPAGITVIAEECFKNCTALHYVHIKGAPDIDSRAFSGAEYAYIAGEADELYGEARDKDLRWGGETPDQVPYAPDPDAIDSGSAGIGLYWQIKKNEAYTNESPKYDMYIDGEGETLAFYDRWGKNTGYNTYKEGSAAEYLDQIINIKIECNITKIKGNFFTGMSNLETVMIPRSLTDLEGAVFEHCPKVESIYLEESEPEKGVFDLSYVLKISAYCFDGCKELQKVIFSEDLEQESIGIETFKNCTGLTVFTVPAMITKIERSAFLNCENLTEVIFELDAAIDPKAFEGCTSLKTFRGYTDSEAESFAVSHGIDFLYPCSVALRMVGSKKLVENIEVIAGQSLKNFEVGGDICLLYTDPEGENPYDMNTPIKETTTLYAKPVYRLSDLKVRDGESLGMRASFALISGEGNDIYRIAAAGALASRDRGTSGALLTRSMSYIKEQIFLGDGIETVPHISLPNSGDLFTFCATGFEGETGLIAERCAEKLSFRGYLILENRKTGEQFTFYTKMISASLYELAQSDSFAPETLKNLTECERSPLTRKEMLANVEKVTLGEMKTLLRGSPEDIEDIEFFDDYLAEQYERTGDVPAIIRFDVNTLFDLGLGTETTLKALAGEIEEYSMSGGSVLLRLRPDNPTNEGTTGGRLNAKDWEYVLKEETPQQNAFLVQLGRTGMLIQFLKEKGVTVYLSFMPDIATENRWWCAPSEKGGDTEEAKQRYRALWEIAVPYLEEDCALGNIIWIYEGGEGGEEYYPGTEYADLYGSDFESSSGKTTLSQMK